MPAIRGALLDAVVAALPVAFVYFAGWAYLSSYLDAFKIDPTQVSVPLTTVLVYAFRPLSNWRVLVPAGVFLAIWQVWSLCPGLKKCRRRLSITAGILALVLLMFAAKWAASVLAFQMAEDVWEGHKSITNAIIDSKDVSDISVTAYLDCKSEDRLRQVIAFQDQIFLLCLNKKFPNYGTLFNVKDGGRIYYYAGRRRDEK